MQTPSLHVELLAAVLVAVGVTAALTPIVRRLAPMLGAVDAPGGRRVHAVATPRMGGIGVVAGYLAGLLAAWLVHPEWLEDYRVEALLGFLAGGVLIAVAGAFDDIRSIGAKRKLGAQTLAAALAWVAGAELSALDLPLLGPVQFGPFLGMLLVIGWIVAFVNAINLIDGLDGLASGVVFFAALTNTIVAIITDNVFAAVLNASLGGAVLGFLFYNFNPATIFLGDTGSMFLGYTLGASALLSGRQKESTLVSLLVPIIALGVPIADTLFAMIRRFLANRPIFSADRGHIHHRLLDLGLTHRRAVLLLYGCSVVLCALALGAAFGKDWQVGMAILSALLTLLGVARFAGYFEIAMLRRQERAHVHSPLTESLRRGLPRLVRDLAEATDDGGVEGGLRRFVLDGGALVWAELGPSGQGPVRWRWDAAGPPRSNLHVVKAEFPLGPDGSDGPVLRFGCLSEEPALALHVELLLQMAADVSGEALARVDAPQGGERPAAVNSRA